MDRRHFLINAYKIGGLAALYSLGVGRAEASHLQDMIKGVIARKNAAAPPPSYTTEFSSIWDGSDAIDTGGSGTGVPWTSETDANSIGDLSGGKYVVTKSASTFVAHLRHTLSATKHDVQAEFEFTPTVATSGWGANNNFQIFSIRNATNESAVLYLTTNGSGAITGVNLYTFNTAGSGTNHTAAYAFADATTYTINVRFKEETSDGPADGNAYLTINSVETVAVTGLDNYSKDVYQVRLGLLYTDQAQTGTVSFDAFVLGYLL